MRAAEEGGRMCKWSAPIGEYMSGCVSLGNQEQEREDEGKERKGSKR